MANSPHMFIDFGGNGKRKRLATRLDAGMNDIKKSVTDGLVTQL